LEAQHQSARGENAQLQQARAKLAQLELLLKQGRAILQDLRTQLENTKTQLEDTKKERDEVCGQRDEMSRLLSELRADRDRIAGELKSAESRRASLEEQLGAAAGDVEQLRAGADRALALAREIVDVYKPPPS
jgi:chromosome segregation ATPase